MRRLVAACAALSVVACAHVDAPPERIGRIYSYVRSDIDGSEAERIHVLRSRRDFIEVAKMRGRCDNAAYVTAELDIEAGHAVKLTGGRLRPGARQESFATLTWDKAARRIDAEVRAGPQPLRQSLGIDHVPWHLYDFDLASLNVALQHRKDPRAGFSFGMALVWPDDAPQNFLRYLGRVDATFVKEETRGGRAALRFDVAGPALGAKGGPLWIDAKEGHIVDAEWGLPNHSEHKDFKLRLTGVSDGGRQEWERLLGAHFEGCAGR